MKTKFFTIQNGAVGTAHTNRKGKTVDFREVKKIEIYGFHAIFHPAEG